MKSLCILEKISMIDVLSKLTHEGVFRKLAFCIEPLIKRFICYLNLVSFMLNLIWEKRFKLIMKLPYSKTGFTIKLPVLIWNLLAQRNSLIPLLNLAKLKTKQTLSPGSLDWKVVFSSLKKKKKIPYFKWMTKTFFKKKSLQKTAKNCWWIFLWWILRSA